MCHQHRSHPDCQRPNRIMLSQCAALAWHTLPHAPYAAAHAMLTLAPLHHAPPYAMAPQHRSKQHGHHVPETIATVHTRASRSSMPPAALRRPSQHIICSPACCAVMLHGVPLHSHARPWRIIISSHQYIRYQTLQYVSFARHDVCRTTSLHREHITVQHDRICSSLGRVLHSIRCAHQPCIQ